MTTGSSTTPGSTRPGRSIQGRLRDTVRSGWTLPAVILLAVAAPKVYRNLRPADPLPDGFKQYSPEAFARAQETGAVLLVDVYASWCATCMAQHRELEHLLASPKYQGVCGLRVDFDTDEDFLRRHRVVTQSTILLFHGERELSRSVGVTDPRLIRGQLDTAVRAVAGP